MCYPPPMFGAFRTILACLVVLQHMWWLKYVGSFAVISFFILSGFLMTMLMDTTYRGRFKAFAINRFLRLYPMYWFTMVVTAAMLAIGLASTRPMVGIPETLDGWMRGILYVNYWRDAPQLIPSSWAVTNEIVFYILIGLGLSRTATRTLAWFAISLIGTALIAEYLPRNNDLTYFSPVAASLPFATGALAYHARDLMSDRSAPWFAAGAGLAIAVAMVVAGAQLGYTASRMAVFIGTPVFVVAMYKISKGYTGRAKVWDDRLGTLSYPIYLNHFTAAMLVVPFLPEVVPHRSDTVLALSVLATSIVMAAVMHAVLDPVIDRRRRAGNVSRNTWITEAVQEKLARNGAAGQSTSAGEGA